MYQNCFAEGLHSMWQKSLQVLEQVEKFALVQVVHLLQVQSYCWMVLERLHRCQGQELSQPCHSQI